MDGEREACAKKVEDCMFHGVTPVATIKAANQALRNAADKIRARQRGGGYDPEVGYFDAWKGSD